MEKIRTRKRGDNKASKDKKSENSDDSMAEEKGRKKLRRHVSAAPDEEVWSELQDVLNLTIEIKEMNDEEKIKAIAEAADIVLLRKTCKSNNIPNITAILSKEALVKKLLNHMLGK